MTEAEPVPGLVQIGETLRAAREVRGMTPDQAASRLRCDVRVIEALEAGRFADIGPAVFARGHLLRYAELLGEPGDAMVSAWAQAAGGSAAGELMADTHPRPVRDLRLLRRRLVSGTAILCAVIVAVWSLQQAGPRDPAAASPADTAAGAPAGRTPARGSAAAPAPQAPPMPQFPATPGAAGASPAAPDAAVVAGAAAPAAPSDPSAAAVAPATAGSPAAGEAPDRPATTVPGARLASARLAVTAIEESWLEVYDQRNRRLFFGVARPGALVDVRGNLPLRVVVGNVPATTFEVDGRRVEVPREAMRGRRAATFRVGPDGHLSAWPRA